MSLISTSLLILLGHRVKSQNATITTSAPQCSADFAFISIFSSFGTVYEETILSERVNFPPYGYQEILINQPIVLFANDLSMTNTMNNPCDISTWTVSPTYYNEKVALIQYDEYYNDLCTVQQWTLNLEKYANVTAVLIGNNVDTDLWTLNGDTSLEKPKIPTRMISYMDKLTIMNTILNTAETMYADINCFNDTTYPSSICVSDLSRIPVLANLALDGEYQRQSDIAVNAHPVWFKENFYFNDSYIWLDINYSRSDNPWRWVIGKNSGNQPSIDIECLLNTTNNEYIDDPTLCGNNWYRDGLKIENLTSHGGVCNLGDSFVCIDTDYAAFQDHYGGRYRQRHKNEPLWEAENRINASVLVANCYIVVISYFPPSWRTQCYFEIYSISGLEAVCPVNNSEEDGDWLLKPWECNSYWTVWNGDSYEQTNRFDIDECYHQNVTVNDTIKYPQLLCMNDPTNADTFYSAYYGVYVLDESQQFDGRLVYKNQRLNGSWYFLFVDEMDSWVINERVPDQTVSVPTSVEGVCREEVDTPNLCTGCWIFISGIADERNCGVSLNITTSNVESDCIGYLPHNNIKEYTPEINLCFADNSGEINDNFFTGTYILSNITFNDRAVWSKTDQVSQEQFYLYYSDRWRYWVIDTSFYNGHEPDVFDLICTNWKEYEPWNCTEWYASNRNQFNDYNVTMEYMMTIDCKIYPSVSPTVLPTWEPSINPTEPELETSSLFSTSSILTTKMDTQTTSTVDIVDAANTFSILIICVVVAIMITM